MKDLFWLTVSKVSVHDLLALLFLGLWWGRASWQKGMVEQSYLLHGSQESRAKEKGEKKAWEKIQPKNFPLVTQVVHTSESFHSLSIIPSNYESIKGLVNWLSQRPQGPITSHLVSIKPSTHRPFGGGEYFISKPKK
jgi:hypothetical protein